MVVDGRKFLKYALLIISVWCVSPPLSIDLIYRLIALASVIYIIYWDFRLKSMKAERTYFETVLLIVYMIVLSMVTGDSYDKRIGTYIFLAIMLSGEIIVNPMVNRKEFYFIVPVVFALCAVWNITTLKGIAEVPNIMRLLAKNNTSVGYYMRRGVGGYGYIYMLSILIPLGIDCTFRKTNELLYRIVSAVFLITGYMVAFQSQYFLAMILSLLIIGIHFALKVKRLDRKIMLVIFLLGIFLAAYVNADRILVWLMKINDMRSIDIKLQSMYNMIIEDGSVQSSEFGTRYSRYMRDIYYAIGHFFLGGFSYGVTGNHSHILDFFAQYGVPLGGVYLVLILKPLKRLRPDNNEISNSVLHLFIIMVVLNTLSYAFGAILYIITPLYYYYVKDRERDLENEQKKEKDNARPPLRYRWRGRYKFY